MRPGQPWYDWSGFSPAARRRAFLLAALCLLAVLAAEEWLSIRHLSITVDEGAHTYAGYQHWKARDFGVNPEHPPLVKLVAAAPLLGLTLQQPHPPPINFMVEQYSGGTQLMDENDGELLLRRARVAASTFTLLLGFLVLAAGTEMFGPAAGLLALTLFTFEPTVLAHGALVTTDMGVACFMFASFYGFYRYLLRPTSARLLVCGVAVGLALASKVSGVLALPILIALALVHLLGVDRADRLQRVKMLGASLAGLFVIAYAVLWSFYTFRYAARPGALTLRPTLAQMTRTLHHPWQTALVDHVAKLHLLPEGYLYGWAKLVGNSIGTPGFLFGHIFPNGTWIYFPAALVIKSSLSLLVLLLLTPFVLKRLDRRAYFPAAGLAISLLIVVLSSMTLKLNIGVRHELAVYPFAVVLAGAAAWLAGRASRAGAGVVAALLLLQCVSSLHSYPDYLPYANEAFGGPSKTYRWLTDSNVDWGQQLKEVAEYVRTHDVGECWFAYSNMSTAPAKLLPCKPLPTGLALIAGVPQPPVPPHLHGTVMISALDASGALWGPGSLNPYGQFQSGRPAELIGNSVLVYRGDFDVPLVAALSHMSQVPMLVLMHQPDGALKEATTAQALDPESPMLEAYLGRALLQLGRSDDANQAFARAVQKARMRGSDEEMRFVTAQIDQAMHPVFD